MKTAIEVLLDAFENSMCKDANQKSRSQYRSVINALGKDEVFKTDAEKNFLTLVIKLIANNREDECIKLIGFKIFGMRLQLGQPEKLRNLLQQVYRLSGEAA